MVNGKIKIAFFLPSLTAGGAERIISFLSQSLNEEIFEVTLIIIGYQKDSKYDVTGIEVIYLNKPRVLSAFKTIPKLLYTNKYDIAMSSIRHLNALMGLISIFFPKTKFVAREANVMSVLDNYPEENDRTYPSFIYRLGYSQLDAIICQSLDMYNDVLKEFPKMANRIHLINNPITHSFTTKQKKTANIKPFRFITVASLEPRKGHLRILDGLALFKEDFIYTIIGNGSQKEIINKRIKELNLENQVEHIPYTDRVSDYLIQSHVFIQGSYVEGFPNALLESSAVGTPVIAFDAPGGINEIVEMGVNGLIIKKVDDLQSAIQKVLLSDRFGPSEVSDSVIKKYNSKTILGKYENLFLSLANK